MVRVENIAAEEDEIDVSIADIIEQSREPAAGMFELRIPPGNAMAAFGRPEIGWVGRQMKICHLREGDRLGNPRVREVQTAVRVEFEFHGSAFEQDVVVRAPAAPGP